MKRLAAQVTLSSTLTCFARECAMDSVAVVKVTTDLGGNLEAVAYYSNRS